jgi:TPP-dependent 2-oxoacid decarboxylase
MIHHCIGPEPDHGVYRGMSEAVRAASTFINDPAVAAEEIDVRYHVTRLIAESHHDMCFEIKTSVYLSSHGHGL